VGSAEGQILLSTSHKRLNKNDKTKVVFEQPTITDWFMPQEDDTAYSKLLNVLVVSNLSFENLHSVYDDIDQWIRCGELIQLLGIIPTSKDKRDEAIDLLSNVQKHQKEGEQLQLEQKGHLDFGAKMNLHMKIKRLEQEINIQLQQIRELC
jgi:hypothetical protein